MSQAHLQSAQRRSGWQMILVALVCAVGACVVKEPQTDVLLQQVPVGPEGARVVLSDGDTPESEYAGTTLEIPPNTFSSPVVLQFYRVRPWDVPFARSTGNGLKIVAIGESANDPQDIMKLSISLPNNAHVDDRNLMAIELDSGDRFYTGGWTMRSPDGKPAALKIETRKLGTFFPVVYPLGPAMPEPLVTPLDILFVVDNSTSMEAYQHLLFQHNGTFTSQKSSLPAVLMSRAYVDLCNAGTGKNLYELWNVHAAVVSSDLGVMPSAMPGGNWPSALPLEFKNGSCGVSASRTWNGDNGTLQTETCDKRSITDMGICPGACSDDKVITERGLSYVRKWSEVDRSGKLVLYPFSMRFVADTAIHCRAVLGQKGCGIEMPYGSALKAIESETSKPTAFLRDPATSLLVVVIVTNEDDCSIDPSRRIDAYPVHKGYQTNPSSLRENCGMLSAPECFNMPYRCFALDNECAEGVDSKGTKSKCKIKATNPNPYLTPVETIAKKIVEYTDAAGNTQQRKIGFVLITPPSEDFETEYLTDTSGMPITKTPYLSLKEKIIKTKSKNFPLAPQLRYAKLKQLHSDPDPKNRFSDPKIAGAVKFVIHQNIRELIDDMNDTVNQTNLDKLGKDFHEAIKDRITVSTAGSLADFGTCN
ncbi:MAG TPA: hypothetical protein PKO07_15140 [Pseudomonadota bacterium]|nr:hypothetical protein [Pseudomonadota bacterium]